jgi:thioredoxin 1
MKHIFQKSWRFYMATNSINDASFEQIVTASKKPILVDFWAEWCGPCRGLGPKLEELSEELGDKVQILKLNIDENPVTPGKFGIRSIPTMIVFKDGQKVDQLLGNLPKEDILSVLNKYI